jgi:hypothetical protein
MLEPQEREALGASCEPREPGLLGMQAQAEHVQDRRHPLAGLLGLLAAGAQDHQVIRVLHQHPEPLPTTLPRLIERVQRDVREQR